MNSFPQRQINSFELSDRLRDLERGGVELSILQKSQYKPTFVRTNEDGTELYSHAGRTVEVEPGQVIDDHGNVINLSDLEAQLIPAISRLTERYSQDSISRKYENMTFPIIHTEDDAWKEEISKKYSDLLKKDEKRNADNLWA